MLLNCGVGEDSWESLGLQGDQTIQFQKKSVLNIHWKDWCWSWSCNTWFDQAPPDLKNWLIRKDPDAGKDWSQEEKGMTEDEMVGWHHWLDGHEFKQAPWVGDGLGSLACCSPQCPKESDMTEWLNWTELTFVGKVISLLFNMLSRSVIAFLPRSKCLLFSWLQSPCAVVLEPKKTVCQCFHFSPIHLPWSDGPVCHDLSVLNVKFKPSFS